MKALQNPRFSHVRKRIVICLLILLGGVIGFMALAGLKKPPIEAKNGERPLKVKAMRAKAEEIQITITGYGEVRPLTEVYIAAEVAGQVVAVNPRLHVGELMAKDELLFQIDPRNYETAVVQTRAEVVQLKSALARLIKQSILDKDRLKTLTRNRELAQAEFDRMRLVFDQHKVGTQSGVDRAEQAFNAAADQSDQMTLAVSMNPLRIKEAQSGLAAAKARYAQAQINLERCSVHAPFPGRLKMVTVKQGQYVAPGQTLLTLSDDTVLEIHVPLDSRDVQQWLRFSQADQQRSGAWFDTLQPTTCQVRWTEAPGDNVWQGVLQRVVDFDPKTRTVTVAVRIPNTQTPQQGGLPLVEGMFCAVDIPGRTLPVAFRIPRQAVGFGNTLYTVVDQRLKTVTVRVAREAGDEVFIVDGIKEGDMVITTRLIDPLEDALVKIVKPSGSKETPIKEAIPKRITDKAGPS